MNKQQTTDCKVPWCNRQSQVNDERCAIHSEVHSAYRSASVVSDSPNQSNETGDAVASGTAVTIYQPGGFHTPPQSADDYSGRAFVEGPHYPEPHKWYAEVTLEQGKIVKVK